MGLTQGSLIYYTFNMPGLGLSLRLGRNRGASGASNDPAVEALLAQAATDGATPMSGDNITYSNTLVTSLKSAGIWDKLDVFYVFATNGDEEFARYNWKDPSTFKCTETGAGALTFTGNEGFTADGTNYLNTNFTPSTDATQYSNPGSSFGVKIETDVSGNTCIMGAQSSSPNLVRSRMMIAYSGSNCIYDCQSDGTAFSSVTSSKTGFFIANNPSADTMQLYRNGALGGTFTSSNPQAIRLLDVPFFIFARNRDGSATDLDTGNQVSIAFVGGDMSSVASAFNTAINNYMTAMDAI